GDRAFAPPPRAARVVALRTLVPVSEVLMRRSVLPLALSLLVLMTGAKARIPAVPARQPSPAGSSLVDVTVHEGTSMAVALSPDRTTLVIDLQGGVWTLPAGGGTAKRITDEYNDARQPS